ncbi:MAG: VOC family protein [Acidobacteriota bacterium]
MKIQHIALRVADPDRSALFYRDLLGLPELDRQLDDAGRCRAIWLDAGGVIVMLERVLRGAGPDTGSAHVLSLAVVDRAAWEERLASAGVAIDDRTGFTLFVRDPDGHRVGLTTFDRRGGSVPAGDQR